MNDAGITSLAGGESLDKAAPAICALGSLDELNAALGLLRAGLGGTPDAARIEVLQRQVLLIGAELATGTARVAPGAVAELEQDLARRSAKLPPLHGFVLPGANELSARAHVARAACRRAEREVVRARETHPERVFPASLAWLNRLSGLLFAQARALANAPP